jgi:hypothetical protein
LPLRPFVIGREEMTDEDRKKQEAVLADIALHKDETIEAYNQRRFGANIIVPEKQKRVN